MKCLDVAYPLSLAFILSYIYSHVGLTDNITGIALFATSQRISATQALKHDDPCRAPRITAGKLREYLTNILHP